MKTINSAKCITQVQHPRFYRDTKCGRKCGLSWYMSKQRKKKKIAAVNDGKKKLNIVLNYHRITHSSSEDSIDVLNDDKQADN